MILDGTLLRAMARVAIRSGRLPSQPVNRMFGGSGSETPCALCGDRVSRNDSEAEIEINRDGLSNPGLNRYRFHTRCFAAWDLERAMVHRPGEPPRRQQLSI